MTALIAPTGEPTERRKFQLTNLDGNNNKFYLVETWNLPNNQVFFRATFGRVGSNPQIDEKVTNERWVERKIAEKQKKGYVEVALHRPAVQVPSTATNVIQRDRKVMEIIDYIFHEAGEGIASYLAVGVDALSEEQIEHGRKLLALAQVQFATWENAQTAAHGVLLAGTVQHFYNAIPTKLPSRIDRDHVVLDFCKNFDEHENRLNQLEAAIATLSVQTHNPDLSHYDTLGADLALLPSGDQAYADICDYIARTAVHGYKIKVREIFTLYNHDERRRFKNNTIGTSNVMQLFHGTAGQNVRHIVRSGLICPRTPSNGRMFGHGIYFANKCTKSANYCSVRKRGRPHFLFLADVAVGNQYIAKDAMSDLRTAPKGHDSVWGKAGETLAWGGSLAYDEFIVYNNAQQTLRYVVLFDK